MEVRIVGGGSYGREKMPHWPHEATGSHQHSQFYVHASNQTMFPSSYKLERELQGLKPLQEGVSLGLGTRSLLSLWYMKSGGHRRWPWPHSWVSQPFQVTTHLWARLSVCLGCGLPSLDIERNWSGGQRQTCMLQKLLHHLQQITAQVYQRGSRSANPQAFQKTDLRDPWNFWVSHARTQIGKAYLFTGRRGKKRK